MPKTGIEPAQDILLHAPKACASANSATSALRTFVFYSKMEEFSRCNRNVFVIHPII